MKRKNLPSKIEFSTVQHGVKVRVPIDNKSFNLLVATHIRGITQYKNIDHIRKYNGGKGVGI